MRKKVKVTVDESLRRDQARVRVVETDGQQHDVQVEYATGTYANPMSDVVLEAKFMANAVTLVSETRAGEIARAVWSLDRLPDIRELVRICA